MKGELVVLFLFGLSQIVRSSGVYDGGFCVPTQHSCSGITCLPETDVCDGTEDCADGSDEANCASASTCPSDEIPCKKSNGQTSCVAPTYYMYYYDTVCTGCGAPPNIANGYVILDYGNEKSTIGAWGDIVCDDGYESCTTKIRCLKSGVWTTGTCEPIPQTQTLDDCTKELGVCTPNTYISTLPVPLRSTNCDDFCQCEHNGTNLDGSVTYKWAKKSCVRGTKLDINLKVPVCHHAPIVACNGIKCYSCKNKASHEECNNGPIETCADNKQACQSVIEYNPDNTLKKILFKGCKNPTAAAANEKLGCKTTGSKTFCRENCLQNLCNEYASSINSP